MRRDDSYTSLAKYAIKHNLDLTKYHEARDQLKAALGSDFSSVDARFAHELLSRLRFNKDVGTSVALAWKALFAKP